MKETSIFLAAIFMMYPFVGNAADQAYLCDIPQGTRVDYFTQDVATIRANVFSLARDQVINLKPKIIIHDNDVTFTNDYAEKSSSASTSEKMKIILRTSDQISFAGMFNGEPMLATLYPLTNVLMYSQQATWSQPYDGVRAVMFYSKCKAARTDSIGAA
jgi:hypothetical protein